MYSASTFKNKTILITGASSGIGKKTAVLLSNLGARCIITGRDLVKLEIVYNQLSNDSINHQIIVADLTNEQEINLLLAKLPILDGIIHSAGIIQPFLIKYLKNKTLDAIWDINLKAPILLTSSLLKLKKINRGASIVFLSSVVLHSPYIGTASYASSKAGIEAFSKVVALEHANQKIRSNTVAPAMVMTPIHDHAEKLLSEDSKVKYLKRYLLGSIEAEDVSNIIIFLLSDLSSKITGTTITIDSGFLLTSS